jgi:hypothetical protein
MWEASAGIITILAVTFLIGMLFKSSVGESRTRSRQEFRIAKQDTGDVVREMMSVIKDEGDQAATGTTLPGSFTPVGNRGAGRAVNAAKEN